MARYRDVMRGGSQARDMAERLPMSDREEIYNRHPLLCARKMEVLHAQHARKTLSVLLALLAVLAPGTALAVSEACEEDCRWYDVPCQNRERECEGRLDSYRTFMDQIGSNVTLYGLPALYVELLRPHYPNVDLTAVRFGRSRKLLIGGMTDCNTIYFASESYVDKVRNGTLGRNDEPKLLYHELTHTEQCAQRGGRDYYADMWWDELSDAKLEALRHENINPQFVHDLMPMEEDAAARATDVLAALPDGLVRSVSIAAFTASATSPQPLNTTITWRAQASGGRGAIEYSFEVRLAGATMALQPFGSDNTFSWTPMQEGSYVVRARARQANPLRPEFEVTVPFEIAGAGGGGGAPFWLGCEEGSVLVGLSLHTGSLVDSIMAICARVNSDGTWRVRGQSNGTTLYWYTFAGIVGGSGGTLKSFMCAPGEGVMRLFGRSGGLIDRLGIECGRLGRVGEGIGIVAPGSVHGPAGGSGGSVFQLQCPADQVATAIKGRADRYIDQIALRCPNLCLDPSSEVRICRTTLTRGTICGLGHTHLRPRPECAGRVITQNAPDGNGNCPSGYRYVTVCDLGAPGGVTFFACMLTADEVVTALPDGLLCGYGHDGEPPRTCEGSPIIKGQQNSCPQGYRYTVLGDLGAPAGTDFFGCVLESQRPVTRMGALPNGLVCGLSHTCYANQYFCGPNTVRPNDPGTCPPGYVAVALGDIGAPAGQGQYFCAKQ